ncbi:MAG: GAF domain-containing protein [Desulfosalsimonas sp.]|uniref:GAF domain-containing protein n=1 Tax=Desulfosalsimonas sp. TaxID=3073848 RepID=UPI0039705B15
MQTPPAIQQGIARKKAVVVTGSQPVVRHDGTSVPIGPEAAVPVFVENQLLAVVSVVAMPETRFSSRQFFLLQDFAETVGHLLVSTNTAWSTSTWALKPARPWWA